MMKFKPNSLTKIEIATREPYSSATCQFFRHLQKFKKSKFENPNENQTKFGYQTQNAGQRTMLQYINFFQTPPKI